MQEEVRLQKYIADCGIASRRRSEVLISQGKVKVNGKVITELGTKVIPGKDVVLVENKEIQLETKNVYIMLNKPKGYITTSHEQLDRPSVMELLKDVKSRIYPIGRLDMDTTGLLLMTNDGDFAYKITHPKHNIRKKYIAVIRGIPTNKELEEFRKGLKIEDYTTAPAEIEILTVNKDSTKVEVIIHEGKKRQVRRMCAAIGHPVISLKRAAIGDLELGNLSLGKWRYLSENELKKLF